MAGNGAAAFNMLDQIGKIEDVLGDYTQLKKLIDVLEGKCKHRHIFIYYQRPDMPNDVGELVDAKGDPKFMIATGEHEDMRIKARAVYFMRNVADQKFIRADVGCDGDLLLGEMTPALSRA